MRNSHTQKTCDDCRKQEKEEKEKEKNNRRILIAIDGEERTLSDWCSTYNMPIGIVRTRITKHDWDPLRALTTKVRKKRKL
jgi:hypothetical protein